jgi:hypothetical protein
MVSTTLEKFLGIKEKQIIFHKIYFLTLKIYIQFQTFHTIFLKPIIYEGKKKTSGLVP